MRCSHPVYLHGHLVPCGKCVNCRKVRINDWYIRMLDEAKFFGFENCSFVTLTYNPENLPEYGLLQKSDYQKFLKRLRITLFRAGFVKESHFSYFLSNN